jgi:anti-sigma regulatory factor (Ser/Thr protein kinase)
MSMPDVRVVALTIPALLAFRDLAVRFVMESCKLVGKNIAAGTLDESDEDQGMPDGRFELGDAFMAEFVSAFSEIYNNIPIHSYRGMEGGTIEIAIRIGGDHISASIVDTGKSFDISAVPLPDSLPTGGMGIHIARSMLDELVYEPGPPNRWKLTKYVRPPQGSS